MTFFSSRVMPRLVPPAVDANAIAFSSRETLFLDAAFQSSAFSSERGLNDSHRGKNDRKRPPAAERRWDYDFGIRCGAAKPCEAQALSASRSWTAAIMSRLRAERRATASASW